MIGSHLARLRQEFKKGLVKQWQKSWMPKWKGKMIIHPSQKSTSGGTSRHAHVPPEVEPQNLDFDVNEFLRSSPNLVVASVFGDCEIIQRAAVRRGYPVMKSQFLNYHLVRERITSSSQRIPPRLLILAFPCRVWSPILNYATSVRVRQRIDR